jgi:nucleotide-binding universal stress UspA family protein
MKRILLAVGDTATTLHTARQIRPWLRERDTSLTLLKVVQAAPLSPLSDAKTTLEQVETVFTGAAEQPGILVRVGDDPAAEICREVEQGGYDLVAMGSRRQRDSGHAVGVTCQAVLRACPVSMFVVPPVVHTEMTAQALFVVPRAGSWPTMVQWLIAQCRSQNLNVILCAASLDETAALCSLLDQASIRAQVVVREQFLAQDICSLARDRRVRWMVLPVQCEQCTGASCSPLVEELLAGATCPVLLIPDRPHAQ